MPVRDRQAALGVYLAVEGRETRVGTLSRSAEGSVAFTVDGGYVMIGPGRPLLSTAWRGRDDADTRTRLLDPGDKVTTRVFLPPFFSNMLPEGALRDLVVKEFGTGDFDDFDVLARLGGDLPGAVVVRRESGALPRSGRAPARGDVTGTPSVRFSLAGVQLKFSVRDDRGTLTVPAQDGTGEIILKTPSPKYPRLPEMEYSAITLCAAVGIETVDARLIDARDVSGVPEEFLPPGEPCLAVRRFDRTPAGRLQIEDFAQILGAYNNQKYTKANQETVFNVVNRFASDPREQVLEAVRRFVANVMIGNGDCHLKNWSFLYGADNSIRLTPAYDVVPTCLYGDRTLALPFGNRIDPSRVNARRFERVANLVGLPPKLLVNEARRMVERINDIWPSAMDELPIADRKAEVVDAWKGIELVREVAPRAGVGFVSPTVPERDEASSPSP